MRLLVSSTIFLLVMLIASEGASAKKCGRENFCRKERSAAAVEKSDYDKKDCETKYNHDESRGRKRRAVDEYQLERSNRRDASRSDVDLDVGNKDSGKKSRTTEKQKNERDDEKKRSRRKEETKCKSGSKSSREQKRKSDQSGSDERTCRRCREDSSEYSDHNDEDIVPNRQDFADDPSASDDSE